VADVTTEAGDRAQLLLLGGLVIAVMFVALALTLNTAIYTENLASRSSSTAGGDASIRFLDTTEEAIGGILERANRNHNESHAAVRRNVTADLDVWQNTTGRFYAASGVVTNISERTLHNGTRIVQTNGSRNVTAADGSSNWTLASGLSGVRQFRLNLTGASLTNATQSTLGSNDVFHIRIDDQSAAWDVYVYRPPSGNVTTSVTVRNVTSGDTSQPCATEGAHAVLNVTAGTVGGDPCPGLSFLSGLQSPYTITYNRTESAAGDPTANGTYHLIVDNGSVARSPGPAFNDAPGDSPWADAAVYAVHYDAVYESARTRYEAGGRIAPGAIDVTEFAEPQALAAVKPAGEEPRTTGGDILEFRIENTHERQVTVVGFEIESTGIDAVRNVNDSNAEEIEIRRVNQVGFANRAGTPDGFATNGTRYDLVDDSNNGGGDAIIDAGTDDAEVDIRRIDANPGTLEFAESAATADLIVRLELSDGSVSEFFFRQA
jgi:hypothetical protein